MLSVPGLLTVSGLFPVGMWFILRGFYNGPDQCFSHSGNINLEVRAYTTVVHPEVHHGAYTLLLYTLRYTTVGIHYPMYTLRYTMVGIYLPIYTRSGKEPL